VQVRTSCLVTPCLQASNTYAQVRLYFKRALWPAKVAAEGPAAEGAGLEQVLRAVLRRRSHRTQG